MRPAQCLKNLTIVLSLGCFAAPAAAADNELTGAEKKAGWQLLFNGKDHTGWKCSNGKKIATPVEQNSLLPWKSGGYLVVYDKPFADFILKCDVLMSEPNCNSGIFFRVGELKNPVYTGFEVQVHSGKGTGYHQFGAIYDIVGTTKNAANGPGKWDSVEIRCKGPNIRVSVNGTAVAELDCDKLDKPGQRADGTKHKFGKAISEFAREGYLGFQDHGQKCWYKNVKLLDLTKHKEPK